MGERLLGYQIAGAGSTDGAAPLRCWALPRSVHHTGEVRMADLTGRRLRPQLAVVLGDAVAGGATAGAVCLAIAGSCLAIEALDEHGVVVLALTGEQLLAPLADGPVQLSAGASAEAVTVASPPNDRVSQVQWLAGATGGLPAGTLILPLPRECGEALRPAPGTWEVRGPEQTTLLARVTP